jgi:outer membrane lipoprotein carrier protein
MKNFFLATILGWMVFSVAAQAQPKDGFDAKAKKILDQLSAKTKTFKNLYAEFVLVLERKAEKSRETQNGKIWVKGAKFKLDLANQLVINDGKTVYTVLRDASEVQISNADEKKKEDAITPANIFTMYEKGFKYEFVKEQTTKTGRIEQHIKLFPLEPKKKNFHTVLLILDKQKNQLVSIKVFSKDGQETTYTIKKFIPNEKFGDDAFAFSPKSYPKYELVDLR